MDYKLKTDDTLVNIVIISLLILIAISIIINNNCQTIQPHAEFSSRADQEPETNLIKE